MIDTLLQLLEAAGEDRVDLSDIEGRLRALGSSAQRAVAESKQDVLVAGAVGGAVLLALTYLYGRRRGRRRASVLEIRRV